jgi:AraC-like DNA-binding protein
MKNPQNMTGSPAIGPAAEAITLDRLSVFLSAFQLTVRVAPPGEPAHLFVVQDGGLQRLAFRTQAATSARCPGTTVLAASVEFGGAGNPLLRSLPAELVLEVDDEESLGPLVSLLLAEARAPRCGGQAALARVGELLVLMVLRRAIADGASQPGLLAGLAHAQLRPALCAILQQPANAWRIEDLADLAHMSRSRFMEEFRRVVGFTPGAFLAGWRLTLAHRRLQDGGRVKTVAGSVGFTSAAAFSRAYRRAFERPPVEAAARRHT